MIETYFVKPNGVIVNCIINHTTYLYNLRRDTKKYDNFWDANRDKYVYIKDAFAFELGWIGVSFWYGKDIKIDDCKKPTRQQLEAIFKLVEKHKCGYTEYIAFIDKFFD